MVHDDPTTENYDNSAPQNIDSNDNTEIIQKEEEDQDPDSRHAPAGNDVLTSRDYPAPTSNL